MKIIYWFALNLTAMYMECQKKQIIMMLQFWRRN